MRVPGRPVPPLLASSASASLGTVQVIENRGFAADWTATVSFTGFTTATGRGWPDCRAASG